MTKRLSDETPGLDEDLVSEDEHALIPYGSLNGDPDFVPVTPLPNRRKRPKAKKKREPVRLSPVGYIAHVQAWHAHRQQLRWEQVPTLQTDDTPVWEIAFDERSNVSKSPAQVFGSTGMPVYSPLKGHVYPADAVTLARWKAKYGKRAEDQIVHEAEIAMATSLRRFFADGGTAFQMERTVPAIEREVRAYCESIGIVLDSFYDPEKRRWFKYWVPPEQMTLAERSRIENLMKQSKMRRAYAKDAWEKHEFSLRDLRSIEGDPFTDLSPAERQKIIDSKYAAMKALVGTSEWHDDLVLAQLKTCDQLMFMHERMMTNTASAGQTSRWEMKKLVYDNDYSEIPLQEIERKQARLDGLKVQYWDHWCGFQAAKRLREETVALYSQFNWGSYRSIEQRANDSASAKRARAPIAAVLQGLTDREFEDWARANGYRMDAK